MTRRERLERKLERRREWADKAETRADSLSQQSEKMMSIIPMGQPILVGHYSEKRDRNYRNRAWNKMGKAVEQRHLAEHHESKADGLETQLDRSIFSDDANAVEELEIRIKNNETKREHMKEVNRLYRKGDAASLAGYGLNLEALKEKLKTAYSWCQQPYPAYELQNLGQRISGDKKRLEQIKAQNERKAEAEAAPNGVTVKPCDGGYCRVTFAEKPERSILDALKAAGFFWCKGYWGGKADQLPAEVKALVELPTCP
jgi:hypothetical protein